MGDNLFSVLHRLFFMNLAILELGKRGKLLSDVQEKKNSGG